MAFSFCTKQRLVYLYHIPDRFPLKMHGLLSIAKEHTSLQKLNKSMSVVLEIFGSNFWHWYTCRSITFVAIRCHDQSCQFEFSLSEKPKTHAALNFFIFHISKEQFRSSCDSYTTADVNVSPIIHHPLESAFCFLPCSNNVLPGYA